MYQIKKFADCWAIFNLESEISRTLTPDEVKKVSEEFPSLLDPDALSLFTDTIESLEDLP